MVAKIFAQLLFFVLFIISTRTFAATTINYYGVTYQENSQHDWSFWNGSHWINTSEDPRNIPVKKISSYVNCNGTTDGHDGVVTALAAVANNKANLIVDCPVDIHVGNDIKKPVFIDNGTTVIFYGSGKFTIDNLFLPGFVLANSNNVNLINWNVEYNNVTPVSGDPGGYYINGKFVNEPGKNSTQGAFNTVNGIAGWLSENRGIKFDGVNSIWNGGAPPMAAFYFIGDDSDINISGMQLYAPSKAGGDAFIPVAFTFVKNFKNNQTVNSKTPMTSQYVEIPHNLNFSNITLDGTLMGFLGNLQNAVFQNIVSNRYSDLQDAEGGTVGGVNKWFPPPHLFYINFSSGGDPNLFNSNLQLQNITDNGIRIGVARDDGVSLPLLSGYANSLKIGGTGISVDNYVSNRPDGFMDVFDAVGAGMTVTNVKATFNSQFIHGYFPGWRFPASPYSNLTFKNVSLTDLAPVSASEPVSGTRNATNNNIIMENVNVLLNEWPNTTTLETTSGKTDGLLAMMTGTHLNVNINYVLNQSSTTIKQVVKSTLANAFQATPTKEKLGTKVTLSWSSTEATECIASGVRNIASGSWSGSVGTSGSKTIVISQVETANFVLTCTNANDSTASTIPIVVTP